MEKAFYEVIRGSNPLGVRISFLTTPGGYHPVHWHEELELLYPLNGRMDVWCEGRRYELKEKHFSVIESGRIHGTYSYTSTAMYLCIHVSRKTIEPLLPQLSGRTLTCIPEDVGDELFPKYRRICELLEEMTRVFMGDLPYASLEEEGLLLQVLARLLRDFSQASSPQEEENPSKGRIQEVIQYVQEHYQENLTLGDLSDSLCLSKEYFSRFFKKHMGVSFLQYLNNVRLSHVYKQIQGSDDPIGEIMERNGFTNQKNFNKAFKERYGTTPSSLRKEAGLEEMKGPRKDPKSLKDPKEKPKDT